MIYRCTECKAEMTSASDTRAHTRATGHGKSATYGPSWIRYEVYLLGRPEG
jgi:hypothetical protein